MCAGVLAYLVLIPTIAYFGGGRNYRPIRPERTNSRNGSQRHSRQLHSLHRRRGSRGRRHHQPLSITAHDLARLEGWPERLRGGQEASARMPRTDQDISMKYVLGIIALIAMIMAFPQLGLQQSPLVALLGAMMIVAFGFLFVTVSSG